MRVDPTIRTAAGAGRADIPGEVSENSGHEGRQTVKCAVWDLDNTIWDGVLLEDEDITLREEIVRLIRGLDERGILQSVASRNDHNRAMEKLRGFGIEEFFLYPQINWNSKVTSIRAIAGALNIGLNAFAFIDDQPYERADVNFHLPEVLCLDARDLDGLLDWPEMTPRFVTEDSRLRRLMYLTDMRRNDSEREFAGPKEEFLASLGMVFAIREAREDDLERAEELTVRTNQLNTTGVAYSYDELNRFRQSADHKLLVTSLEDRFGSYGKIGLALIECGSEVWTIKLLLMSCRVMNRGVGAILIHHVMRLAKEHGKRLRAEFVPNGVNRMMYVTYKFTGFREVVGEAETALLENDLSLIQPYPDYVKVLIA
jgi:FkbH-like protein